MYSLIRFWIGLKLARMLIQLRVVVRTTRASDRTRFITDLDGVATT